jgi:hypothetical protein
MVDVRLQTHRIVIGVDLPVVWIAGAMKQWGLHQSIHPPSTNYPRVELVGEIHNALIHYLSTLGGAGGRNSDWCKFASFIGELARRLSSHPNRWALIFQYPKEELSGHKEHEHTVQDMYSPESMERSFKHKRWLKSLCSTMNSLLNQSHNKYI